MSDSILAGIEDRDLTEAARLADSLYIGDNTQYDSNYSVRIPATKWFVIDGSTAEPEVNWPGDLISEHDSKEEARLGRARAILEATTLLSQLRAEKARIEEWQPIESAPRDGSWIIAVCHDGVTLCRVSWGRDQSGYLGWCSTERSYGEQMFPLWVPWPTLTKGEGK